MASVSISATHSFPSLLHSQTPTLSHYNNLSLFSSSSNSHFHGIKLCTNSTQISVPSLPYVKKSSIFAKVTEGSVPPGFTLKDQDGKNVSLSKFKGKPVVVYFYPADESPGCTKQLNSLARIYAGETNKRSFYLLCEYSPGLAVPQACAFRDSYEKFKKAGAQVVGISVNDSASHKAFAQKFRLPFSLLSDEGDKVRKEWGVPSDLFGVLPGRQTYVLDRNGVCRLVYNNQFQPEKHIDETLKFLNSV